MQLKARTNKIRLILRTRYPQVKTALYYKNPFELLIATILSAQCTDNQVNRVTATLFETFKTPGDFAQASLATIEEFIRPTGFFHNKAKSINKCAQALVENFGGQVPDTLDQLVKLPGVGRKTANSNMGSNLEM